MLAAYATAHAQVAPACYFIHTHTYTHTQTPHTLPYTLRVHGSVFALLYTNVVGKQVRLVSSRLD